MTSVLGECADPLFTINCVRIVALRGCYPVQSPCASDESLQMKRDYKGFRALVESHLCLDPIGARPFDQEVVQALRLWHEAIEAAI